MVILHCCVCSLFRCPVVPKKYVNKYTRSHIIRAIINEPTVRPDTNSSVCLRPVWIFFFMMAAVPDVYNSPFQCDVIITHNNDAKINPNELVTEDWTRGDIVFMYDIKMWPTALSQFPCN